MLFSDPDDPFTLSRFLQAQQRDYATAVQELKQGHKRSHWMWYVFPQFKGLGSSSTSTRFAIRSLDEAKAFLDHPVLGQRLRECTEIVLTHQDKESRETFGDPDYLKFRSCMTLFAEVSQGTSVFQEALDAFHGGHKDPATLELLAEERADP